MTNETNDPPPIICAHLLRTVDERLLTLLRSLSPEEWNLQTVAPLWKVGDVAAHLLDTALRKLSLLRDCHHAETVDIRSPRDFVAFINRINREGVLVYRRLSPPLLIDMMELACEQSARFHESLDPFAVAGFPVSWAGEETSLNWFDTARELTERWHHQQQIRLSTNRPGIMTPELYRPVLDCFMRGLPYHYRNAAASPGALLLFEISGECGGQWALSKGAEGWRLVGQTLGSTTSRVVIPQEVAWRIFTKGIDRDAARKQVAIKGNQELGDHIFSLTAIVA